MQAPTQPNQPQQDPMLALNIVWVALMTSVVVLGAVLQQLSATWPVKEGFLSDADFGVYPIIGVAALLIPFSILFPKFILASQIRMAKSLPPGGDLALRARSIFFIPVVLRLALSEAIGVNGFVCAQIKQNMQYYYLGAGIALVLIFLARPKREDLQDVERQLGGFHGNIR